MNRVETGGGPGPAERDRERDRGVAGNSPTGAAMQANEQNTAVTATAATTPAPNLVGPAGSSVEILSTYFLRMRLQVMD